MIPMMIPKRAKKNKHSTAFGYDKQMLCVSDFALRECLLQSINIS